MRIKIPPVVPALISAIAGEVLTMHYSLAPAVVAALVLAGWAAFFCGAAQPWLLLVPALTLWPTWRNC